LDPYGLHALESGELVELLHPHLGMTVAHLLCTKLHFLFELLAERERVDNAYPFLGTLDVPSGMPNAEFHNMHTAKYVFRIVVTNNETPRL
jgi:hypothetical protein